MHTVDQRYVVMDLIGSGASAAIYRAFDQKDQVNVALKVYDLPSSSFSAARTSAHEFEILKRLEHPNVIRVLDHGNGYIALELVRGVLSREAVAEGFAAIVDTATEIAGALEFIHSKGVIHTDLKTENILVGNDGAIRLADFGLARTTAERLHTECDGSVSGTLSYMAPEQIRSNVYDHRADLYSLGVIMYELSTGVLPFEAADVGALVTKHLEERPQRPSARVPSFPPALDALIMKLLEKSPSSRPQSATEVLLELRKMAQDSEISRTRVQRGSANLLPPAFAGRDAAMTTLQRALGSAKEGDAACVIVAGEDGSGKTTVLDRFCAELAFEDALFMRHQCAPGYALPYTAVKALMRDGLVLLQQTAPPEAKELMEQWQEPLEQLTPELRFRNPSGKHHAMRELSPAEIRTLLTEMLALLARQAAVVAVIEDAQHLDAASGEFVSDLMRSLADHRFLLCISQSTSPRNANCSFALNAAVLKRRGQAKAVQLQPLAPEMASRMALSMLGKSSLPPEVLQAVVAQCEGLPSRLVTAMKYLADEHIIVLDGDRWRTAGQFDPSGLRVPFHSTQSLLQKIPKLSMDEQAILQVAAVFGGGMTHEAVAAIAKKPPLRVDCILQKFEQEGFLHSVIADGRREYAFTDEATREHMCLKYDTNTRAEIHERIAGVIEKEDAGREKKRLSALAHHYSHSFEHKKAIAYLVDAAREAASRGDHQMAEEFARTGLDKITVAKKYENMIPALTLIRAEALARTRRAPEAVPLYEQFLANREAMAEMELQIRSGLSRSYLECRRHAEALQQAARVLELCRPGTRAFVEASLLTAKAHVAAGTFPVAAARLRELLRTVPAEDECFCEIAVLYARALFWTGDWERAMVWLRKGLCAQTIWTLPLVRAHAFLVLSLIDIQKSRADAAEPRIKDAIRIAAQEADDELLLQAQLTLARCMFATDRLDEALRTAKGAAARADELGLRHIAELCRLLMADILSAKESPDMAIELASQAMSFFLKADSAAGIGLAHLSLGQACVRNANTSRAVVHLKKAERCFESAQMPWTVSEVLLWHAKAHVAGGDAGAVAGSLAKCRAIATAFGQQAVLLKADFVHATLDMKQQHLPSAVKRLSATMENAAALGLRVLAAECTCALARIAIEYPEHIANPQEVSRKLDAVIETLNTVSVEIAAKRAGLLKRELQSRLAPSEKRGQDNTFSDQIYVLSGQAKGRLDRIAFEVELGMTNQSDMPAVRQEIDKRIAVIKSELDERLTDLADSNLKLEAQNKCLVEETNRLRAIQDIIRAMNSTLDEEALINLIMDVAIRQVNAERGFLLLKDDNDNLLFRAARNIEKESIDKPEFKVSMSIARRTINSGEPIVTANAQLDERFLDKSSVLDLRLKSVLCVPLKAKDQIMGAVYVDNRFSAGIFSERELDFLVTFAHHACVAIRNARLYEDLKKQEGRLEQMNAMLSQKLNKTGAELDQIKESLRKEQQRTLSQPYYCGIVSRSPQMEKVFALIDRIGQTSVPVFLLGERGTGKELIAKAIHLKSPRKDKAFVIQNCGAVAPSLLESELFGHTRGSFTGADRDRIGVFELADGGTLFLDEIGDMSLEMQTSILRVVQDGQFRRIGGKDVIKVDVRIVCATNHDMPKLLKEGRFREDLWDRLSVVTINIPPLRDRKEDIPILVEHFLQKAVPITGGKKRAISKQAMARLVEYNWPGNVRQLENEIYRAAAMAESNIDEAMVLTQATKGSPGEAAEPEIDITNMKQLLKKMQRQLLDKALQKAGGNKAEAARLLGISRQGLLKMLDRHGVEDAAEDELA